MLPEMPSEIWCHIANLVPMEDMRGCLEQRKMWSLIHPLFLALRREMCVRLEMVSTVVRKQREMLCSTSRTKWATNLYKIPFSNKVVLMRIVAVKEKFSEFTRLCSWHKLDRIAVSSILAGFCSDWMVLLLEDHPFFVATFTTDLSGASLPEGHRRLWRDTYICSVRICALFLTYHYDIHVETKKMRKAGRFQIACCAPCRWESTPACSHRNWVTWSTIEFRDRLVDFLMRAILWVMGESSASSISENWKERYCDLVDGDDDTPETHERVHISADVALPPPPD